MTNCRRRTGVTDSHTYLHSVRVATFSFLTIRGNSFQPHEYQENYKIVRCDAISDAAGPLPTCTGFSGKVSEREQKRESVREEHHLIERNLKEQQIQCKLLGAIANGTGRSIEYYHGI